MLIARAPVRITFGGGGTDLEAYYARYGGFVVNATINKYFYMMVSSTDSDQIQIISADLKSFFRTAVSEPIECAGDLVLPKTVLRRFGLRHGFNVFLASEIPPGTGLGSSGAVTVAMIKGLGTLTDRSLTKEQVAELACDIEINELGAPVGKQDQFAASFGGINAFTFTPDGVSSEPLQMDRATIKQLESELMLFFTGSARPSLSILQEQREASRSDRTVIESLHATKQLAGEMKVALERGALDQVGALLHSSWQHKKRFATNVSNRFIDECYEEALAAGAMGGKLIGAGGGGFLMLLCEPPHQPSVTAALEARGLRQMQFEFEYHGAQVLLNT